ncbi:hypothetical protein MEO_05392 [Candida albicans P94015]|nr:hypothetical protein MEO_05392 [Candida albicans P94015]
MKFLQKFIITVALLTNIVFAIDITENKVDRGSVTLSFGEIIIHPGASWSIIDNAFSNFIGKLDVKAKSALYISSTSHLLALQVSLTTLLHSINNSGIISFDSRVSLTPSSYDLRGLSFTNSGEMYFAASGRVPSTMSLTSASWTNTGLLSFYQNQRTSGAVCLGFPLGSITNSGKICLNNQVYQQTTQIKGSGCFSANGDSTIYIANVLLSVSANQNFHLVDKDSSMIVQAISTTQTFNVYGFGNGNKIGLTLPLIGIILESAHSYDSSTGILTLRNFLLEQRFNIGLGYDSSKFSVVTDSGSGIPSTIWGSVTYTGRVPTRALPKSCQMACKPIPEAPGVKPTDYTTTITKTNTAGNTVTETGAVTISTDKSGSWFTTTSIFPTLTTATSISITTTLSNEAHIKTTDNTLAKVSSTVDYISAPISSSEFISLESFVDETLSNENPILTSTDYASENSFAISESTFITASDFQATESLVTESYFSKSQSTDSESFVINTSSAVDNSYVSSSSSADGSSFPEETHMLQTSDSDLSSTAGSESDVTEFSDVSLATASDSSIADKSIGTESLYSEISLVSASESTGSIGELSISGDTLFKTASETKFVKSSFSSDLISETSSELFVSSSVSIDMILETASDSFITSDKVVETPSYSSLNTASNSLIASKPSTDSSSYTTDIDFETTTKSFAESPSYFSETVSEIASKSSLSMVEPSCWSELPFETSIESLIAPSYISSEPAPETASESFIVKPSYSEIASESITKSIISTIEASISSDIFSDATTGSIVVQPSVSSGISLEIPSESMLFSESSISKPFISSQSIHECTSDSILVVPSFFSSDVSFETVEYSSTVSTSVDAEPSYSSEISLKTPSESFIVSETFLEPSYSGEVVLATPSESVVASETDVNKPSYSNEAVLQTPSESYILSETGVKESSESSEFALSTPSTSFIASETFTVQSFASSEVSFGSDRESTISTEAIQVEPSISNDVVLETASESFISKAPTTSEFTILSETSIVEPSILSDLRFETTSQSTEMAPSATGVSYFSSTETPLASSSSYESSFATSSVSAIQSINSQVASASFVSADSTDSSEVGSSYTTASAFGPASSASEEKFISVWETSNSGGSFTLESSTSVASVVTTPLPFTSNDIITEISSTWNGAKSDSPHTSESDITSQYNSHSTSVATRSDSISLTDTFEIGFASTWTTGGSGNGGSMKSDVSNQDSYATMLPTSFLDTSNSDITTGVVSTWDAKNSNSYTSAELSTDPYSSDGYASSATAALSITESIPTTDTINTEYHSNGDITTSGGFKEISLTSHYEGGFTSESAGYTIASPSGSTQEFATATITSCFESKCSENVVTYISSVSHSTVTTGYEDTRFTGSIFSGDLASTGDNIVSASGRSVTDATNPFATNTDIGTTSTVSLYGDLNDSDSSVSGYPTNRSDSNGYANTPTTGSNTSGDFSQTIETGSSSFTAIPFENGSTNISNKYLKFLGTVVSILILLI